MLHICPNMLHSQVCWWRGGRLVYSMSICHRAIYGLLQAAANLQTQTTKWVHKYRWHATGSWQEYTIPSGYKFASTTFPHLQPSDVRGDGLRKPVKLFLFFFFPHRYIMWVTGWGARQPVASTVEWYILPREPRNCVTWILHFLPHEVHRLRDEQQRSLGRSSQSM